MYVVGVCECEWGGVVGLRPLHTDDTLHLLVCGVCVYVLCICVVCVLCMCCVCVVFFLNCVV